MGSFRCCDIKSHAIRAPHSALQSPLHGPQDLPDMTGMVPHAGQSLDHGRHPWRQGPQIGAEAAGACPLGARRGTPAVIAGGPASQNPQSDGALWTDLLCPPSRLLQSAGPPERFFSSRPPCRLRPAVQERLAIHRRPPTAHERPNQSCVPVHEEPFDGLGEHWWGFEPFESVFGIFDGPDNSNTLHVRSTSAAMLS